MLVRYLIPIFALLGALFGIFMVFHTQRVVPTTKVLFPPPKSPYQHYIAGVGMIESSSENIVIGTPFNEVVAKINVVEGDMVKQGDVLFELDLRNFNAALQAAQAQLKASEIALETAKVQFSFYGRLNDKKAVSEQIYQQTNYAFQQAEANLAVSQAAVLQAQANIDRSIIKAPIDGKILQVNMHVGEIALVTPPEFDPSAIWQTAQNGNFLLMGKVTPMQLRIDIDEADTWKYDAGSAATAFVRGNRNISIPLTFNRVEPYMIVKPFFTGAVVERIDTRVMQVIYQFDRGNLPIYPGQLLDVYIETRPLQELLDRKY